MAGFSLVNSMASGEFSGQTMFVSIPSGNSFALAQGDAIVGNGTSDSDGRMRITKAGTTGAILGIINSFAPRFAGEALDDAGGIPDNTEAQAQIITDQNTLYRVPVTGGTVAASDVGQNIATVVTTATKTGGLTTSNMSVLFPAFPVQRRYSGKLWVELPTTKTRILEPMYLFG